MPKVILISIDTLRADHLGCYGYKSDTSPNIDKFAKDSILFNNAYSQYPATIEAHASIMTGLYPNTHGAQVYADTSTQQPIGIKLNSEFITIAENMKSQGYLTFCFGFGFGKSLNVGLDKSLGLNQGFNGYYSNLGNATRLNHKVFQLVDEFKENKLFLFIHYYDVHSDENKLPYEAPYPYSKMFTRNYKGNFLESYKEDNASVYLSRINLGNKIVFRKEVLNYIIDLYDQGVAYVDNEIGKLLNFLKDKGLYENSLIILLADHGEAFGEHSQFLHGTFYDEVIHIPLIVKFPYGFFRGKKINGLVESIDIMPSILQLLGFPIPERVQGKEFLSLVVRHKNGKSCIFSGNYKYSTIRTKNRKLIYAKDQSFEVYNLDLDPKELHNLYQSSKTSTDILKLFYLFDEWNRKTLLAGNTVKANKANLDKGQIDTMRSLGYLQ